MPYSKIAACSVSALLYRAGFDSDDARVVPGTDPPVVEVRAELVARDSFRVRDLSALSAKYDLPIEIRPA